MYEFEATPETYGFDQAKRIFSIYADMLKIKAYLIYEHEPIRWGFWAWASRDFPRVTLGPGFFRLNKQGQVAVLIHELLHVKYPAHLRKKRSRDGKRRQKGVHSGRWKQAALKWGEHVLYIHPQDILPEWRVHPYAKEPSKV